MTPQPQSDPLTPTPTPNRYITTHTPTGLSIFNTTIPEPLPPQPPGPMTFHLGYATTTAPANFTNNSDLTTFSSFLQTPPTIYIPGGSVMRIVEMQPGHESPMHRTLSLDYGVVLDGEAELELDSGEKRVLRKGGMVVQRGTRHLWRNASATEVSWMVFVTLEGRGFEVGGRVLEEDLAGL